MKNKLAKIFPLLACGLLALGFASCTMPSLTVGSEDSSLLEESFILDESYTHEHNYVKTVTAPTCETDGYTTYSCDCGDEYTTDHVTHLGHNLLEHFTFLQPTCSETGIERYTCNACDYYEDVTIDTVDHNTISLPDEKGYNVKQCTTCLNIYKTPILYTITYLLNGGNAENPANYTIEDTVILNEPYKMGYTFVGWTSTDFNGTQMTVEITQGSIGSKIYTANWLANTNTPYTIRHYQENINDDGYTLFDVETLEGETDTFITPSVNTYKGFTSPSTQRVKIQPDGLLVVEYYYSRNYYELSFITNGGNEIENISAKYQTVIDLPDCQRDNCTFGGWFTDANLTSQVNQTIIDTTQVIVYAWWMEENKPTDFTYSGTSTITISAYNGKDDTMWIPAYINNVPVTTIVAKAFENKSNLLKVVVPNTVTQIGEGAFKGCNSIQDITLPFVGNTISSTYHNAVFGYIFGYKTQKPSLLWEGTVLKEFTNSQYSSVTGAIWQWSYRIEFDSLLRQESYFYYIPTTIKNVTITMQTKIPMAAFNGCDFIESITLPATVTSIDSYAFQNCNSLKSIYYMGTEEQWNNIKINSQGNSVLLNALHYYTKTT